MLGYLCTRNRLGSRFRVEGFRVEFLRKSFFLLSERDYYLWSVIFHTTHVSAAFSTLTNIQNISKE